MKMSKKSEVVFVDTSPEVKKVMAGLAKSALRASGKVVRKHIRDDVPLRTKRIKNHIASWVFIDRKTGQPQMQIGFYGWQKVKKRGKQPSHSSPWWIEEGTKPHLIHSSKTMYPGEAATHVLRNSVYNNISEIRAAQEEYLKLLSEEIEKAKSKIDDKDYEEDD